MTQLHTGLAVYRDQLRGAIARDLKRRRRAHVPRRALRFAIPTAVAGVVVAGVLALTPTFEAPVQPADAAILGHVAAALTAPPGMILHERALVTVGSTTRPYELWAQNDAPYSYRVEKWGYTGTGASSAPTDPAAMLHSLVETGHATVDALTVLDGVPAYRLTVSGSPDRFLNGTVYVSRADYRPLLIDTTANGGERIRYLTYEYVTATAANLRLLHTH